MTGSGRPGIYNSCKTFWVTVPLPQPIAERILDNPKEDMGLRELVLDVMVEAKPDWPWPDELMARKPVPPQKRAPK